MTQSAHYCHSWSRSALGAALAAATTGALLTVAPATPAAADPPAPPSAADSRTHLNALTVAPPGSMAGYSRDKFPHWIDQGNNCNTREVVLKRDGTNVKTDSECRSTSGSWHSVYDNKTLTSATQVQIDHMVPLADAWRSGASKWTTAQRRAYANDLTDPQLIAVSGTSNNAKGDQDPSQWKPANTGVWCLYGRWWIQVKYRWKLAITSGEKTALADLLNHC